MIQHKKTSAFSTRKVSVNQAIKLLGRNGILVNKEKAEIILDFLYLIAKTYKKQQHDYESEPKEEIEHLISNFSSVIIVW